MAAALILSADTDAIHLIEELAASLGVRTRSISSAATAEEWITASDFDALLVDSIGYDGLRLIESAWKSKPQMVGGVFNLAGPMPNIGRARLLGAEVFQAPGALQEMRQMFEILARRESPEERNGVLVIDDLDAPRSIICSLIQGLGFDDTIGASSVDEALQVLRREPDRFFCVITDINMPHATGADLIQAIRADKDLRSLPAVILSAHASPENVRGSIAAGASGVLVKPPKKKALMSELEKARRMVFNRQDPRLCYPEELPIIEEALATRLGWLA